MLLAIWIAFLCKGLFYSTFIPMWEGYDEYAHFAFIQHVAVHHRLPVPETRVSREVDRSLELAPLPWELNQLTPPHLTHEQYWQLPAVERIQRQQELLAIPREWQSESGEAFLYEGKQGPVYYWLMTPVYWLSGGMSLPSRVFLFRLINILLASLVIPIAFAASRAFFDDADMAIAVCALIASMPELYMDAFRVGNQSLAMILYGLFTLFCLKAVGEKPVCLRAAGVILGLMLVTRAYTLAAIPAMLLVCAATIRRASSHSKRKVLLLNATALTSAAVIAGWWYVRNLLLTRSIIWYDAVPSQPMGLRAVLQHASTVHWRSAFASLSGSHIWFGNWSFLSVRSWMYHVFEYVALIAALGLVVTSIKKFTKGDFIRLFVILTIYGGFLASIAYHVLMNSINFHVDASAGWYLYSVIVAEAILFTAGLFAFRWGKAILTSVTGFFFLLEMYATHFLLIPYYTGLISHAPDGGLRSFHVSQLNTVHLSEVIARLTINRPPFATSAVLTLLWCSFFAASAALPVIAARAGLHVFGKSKRS